LPVRVFVVNPSVGAVGRVQSDEDLSKGKMEREKLKKGKKDKIRKDKIK
jgi:hypothetical protein